MNRTSSWLFTLRALALATVLAWALVVAMSLQTIGKPFPGFFFEANMLVSTLRYPDWTGMKAGIATYDRLIKANGQPLETPEDLERLVERLPVGSPVSYEVMRDGRRLTLTAETQLFKVDDFVRSCLPFFVSSASFLLIGITVFWLRPHHPAAQAHLLFSLSWAIFLGFFIDMVVTHRFPLFYLSAIYLQGSTFLHLAFTFPEPMAWLKRRPFLVLLPYGPALLAAVLLTMYYRPLGMSASPEALAFHSRQLTAWSIWSTFGTMYFIGHCAFLARWGREARVRQQVGVVLVGALASFLPAVLIFLVPQLMGQIAHLPSWLTLLEMACFHIFPLSIAYAIIRHQLFDIRLVIRRATLYAALIAGLALLYVAVAGIGYAILGSFFPIQTGPSLPGFIAALGVAVAFRPFHDHLRRGIDRLFLGKRASALQVLTRFSRRTLPDEPTLAQELLKVIEQALQPRWICLVLADQTRYVFGQTPSYVSRVALPASGIQPLSLRALVPEAEDQAVALILEMSSDRRHGLFIGPTAGDMPYNSDELAMLRALMGQAAIAFQNAHLVEERIRLTVQEGLARTAATERQHLLMQIVHDIKSDLFNISLALHLARKQPDHPDALESIHRSLERIDSLLSEKVCVVKQGRQRGTTPLLPALEEAMATVAPQLTQKEQWLDFKGAATDAEVPLSAIELKQVVLNLLSNASKFSPTGTTITLDAQLEDGSVVMTVQDEGPGVPANLMDDLATGKRADASVPGSGFGLQNIKALIEGVGGALSWRNNAKGAVFEVRVPLEQAAETRAHLN